ncbi:hypothetical protein ACYPKM_01810 [Pseudomonas aeruginosa]
MSEQAHDKARKVLDFVWDGHLPIRPPEIVQRLWVGHEGERKAIFVSSGAEAHKESLRVYFSEERECYQIWRGKAPSN